ncbi:MAG: DUF4197 domain-containing protein [Saprospiraceae bacterium]|nr:DUF4197 domain-containing protein [Saprospiraceae bacterium]
MKKIMTLLFCLCLFQFSSNAQFGKLKNAAKKAEAKLKNTGSSLSSDEIGKGLKEALNVGVGDATDFLSTENGYLNSQYKILLPEEAQKVIKKVKRVPGFENADEKMTKLLNAAAEKAASKAKPIFINSIKQMTINDAIDILMGEKNAATQYLNKTTRKQLFTEFIPVVQESLDEVNARTYWTKIAKAYNRVSFGKKVNTELDQHVTNKALDGMFSLVEVKELDIRENKSARSSDLLTKVFARQDK